MTFAKIPDADIEKAENIYISAFPPEERRPWHDIISRDADSSSVLSLFGIYCENSLAGILSIWKFDTIRYIEHLAIADTMRGFGIGSQALTALIASDPLPIVIEVEPESLGDIARRRINFYRRHGFIPHHHFQYIQPPYDTDLPPVKLILMSTAPIDLVATTGILHSQVYSTTMLSSPQSQDK